MSEPPAPEVTPERARNHLIDVLEIVASDRASAAPLAVALLRHDAAVPPELLRGALRALLADLTARAVAHGWGPNDLVNMVTRQLGEARVPVVIGLVVAETERHPRDRVAQAWRDELEAAGLPVTLDLQSARALQAALELAACMGRLPSLAVLIPPPGTAAPGRERAHTGDPKLLARVRALLAKAESTEYDEEAEALSAKAQELISRHSLEQLLAAADAPAGAVGEGETAARRIWIDPPYVFAKGMLVDAVADANGCRSVIAEKLGFCTVLGAESDLAAVDVLVTSLLVQASTAMRRHGRQVDGTGTSRTKSFRQSFWVSYAARIRERLHVAADAAARSTGRSGDLVPVLHRRGERLDAATQEMFPHLVTRRASIGNAKGWAAGRAAADLARLDTEPQLSEAG